MPATRIRSTLGEIVNEALRLTGDRLESFTATSGAGSMVVAENIRIQASTGKNDFYNDAWFYVFDGASAGDERSIIDYVGATKTIELDSDLTATPDSTSKILISRYRPQLVEDAVKAVIRDLSKLAARPLAFAGSRVGNVLRDGHMEFWDDSSNVDSGSYIYTPYSTRGGWKVQGTSAVAARESTIARNSSLFTQFSAKLTSNSTNDAYLEQLIDDWGNYAGESVSMKGQVYATAAARAYLRLADGVTNTQTDTGGTSGEHTATAGWEELSKSSITVATAATKLGVQCFIEGTAGGSISAYFDDIRLLPDRFVYTLHIPNMFVYLKELHIETGTEGVFVEAIPLSVGGKLFWKPVVHDDGEAYVQFAGDADLHSVITSFDTLSGLLTKDRHVLIDGWGYRTDTIATTTDIEIEPSLVAHLAAAQVAESRQLPSTPLLRANADKMLRRHSVRKPNRAIDIR